MCECACVCVWTNHNTQYNITNYFHIVVVSFARNFQQFRKTFYTARAFTNTACLPASLPAVVGVVSANTTPTSHPLSLSLSCTHTHSLTLCPTTCTDCAACMHVCVCLCPSLARTIDFCICCCTHTHTTKKNVHCHFGILIC